MKRAPSPSPAEPKTKRKKVTVVKPSLRTEGAERKVWLVKMPKFAWKGIESQLASGKLEQNVVGKMTISENARGENMLKLVLHTPVEGETTGAVAQFNGVTSDRIPAMVAMDLKEDKATSALMESTIEGTVVRSASFRPDLNGKRPMMKASRPVIRDKFIKPSVLPSTNQVVRKKDDHLKNTRMDKSKLEEILFGAFEDQPNWKLEQLRQYTKQPMEWLRQVVNGICVHVKRGQNKNTFELKPEWKPDQ